MPVISAKHRDTFAANAALTAIEIKLRSAYRARANAEREVQWLERLRTERVAQIEAGTWPTKPAEEASQP